MIRLGQAGLQPLLDVHVQANAAKGPGRGWWGPAKGGTHGSTGGGGHQVSADPWASAYNEMAETRGWATYIPETWEVFDAGVVPGIAGESAAGFGHCFQNSLDASAAGEGSVVIGQVVSKAEMRAFEKFDSDKYWAPGPMFIVHAWNVDAQGRVIDHTFGSSQAKTYQYMGKALSKQQVAGFKDDAALMAFAGKFTSARRAGPGVDREYERWSKR